MRRVSLVVALLGVASLGPGCQAVAGLDRYRFEGGSCSESPCSLLEQCGCGEGEGCYYSSVGMVAECAPAGAAAIGAACDPADGSPCEPGAQCVRTVDGGDGYCIAFCEDDSDCTGTLRGAARCLLSPGDPTLEWGWCTLGCDPTDPSDCDGGGACRVFVGASSGGYATHCVPPAAGAQGDACTGGDDCGAGLDCAPTGVCTAYCVLGGESNPCPEGLVCDDVIGPVVFDSVFYGLCVVGP